MSNPFQKNGLSKDTGRIFKFCCTGIFNTALTICLYLFFSSFMDIYISNVFSWCAGCVCSYVINKNWTFKASDTGIHSAVRFVIVTLCSMGLGLGIMHILATLGGGRIWSFVLSLPFTMIASYLGYRFWSFKEVDGENRVR